MGETDVTPPVAPPPKKRSLFKRRIVDVPDNPVEDGVEFFSRAKDLFPIRAAEEEKRRQKIIEKLQQKRPTASADSKAHDIPDKRRRVSSEVQDEDDGLFDTESSHRPFANSATSGIAPPILGANESHGPLTSLSDRYTEDLGKIEDAPEQRSTRSTRNATVAKHAAEPISISDDDDDNIFMSQRTRAIPDEDEPEIQEVEELPHLVAKARERQERLKALELRKANAFSGQNYTSRGSNSGDDDIFEEPKISADEATVEILVTSMISNTTPLIVRRKLYQTLKVVREVWVDKFIKLGVLPASLKNSIILTWRQKQLFDVSTCEDLCLPNTDSSVSSQVLDENGRLHLEIWTHDLLKEHLRKQAEPTPEPQPEELVIKYKILLKGIKDKVPLKMKCAPSSLVQRMVDQYRKTHALPDNKEITLQFEGDKLDPTMMISETVLGEEDADGEALQVECYVN